MFLKKIKGGTDHVIIILILADFIYIKCPYLCIVSVMQIRRNEYFIFSSFTDAYVKSRGIMMLDIFLY